jgi:hypothetical protein
MNQIDYCATSELDHLKTRTVISIPDGGPVYTGLCTVLFWMAHGKAKDVYDINVKYFDGSLLADLLLPLWHFISSLLFFEKSAHWYAASSGAV